MRAILGQKKASNARFQRYRAPFDCLSLRTVPKQHCSNHFRQKDHEKREQQLPRDQTMKTEYDLAEIQSRKNLMQLNILPPKVKTKFGLSQAIRFEHNCVSECVFGGTRGGCRSLKDSKQNPQEGGLDQSLINL
jgi:hypothetical protein